MTKLSVNINKVALIRNARGENLPDLVQFAVDCEEYGAEGITVHPRPDERHVRYDDLPKLKEVVKTELNIEGYPNERFLSLVENTMPHQCTLVPDPPGVLTSNEGWNTMEHADFLKEIIARLHSKGIRVSLFLNPDADLVSYAKETGTDRIEFYTGTFARTYIQDSNASIADHITASKKANELGLGINAGHDLNLNNLKFYASSISGLLEVSIGHALISDALYYGIKNTIQLYKRLLT
jgi:pyridoxine 5-phosphate synthase